MGGGLHREGDGGAAATRSAKTKSADRSPLRDTSYGGFLRGGSVPPEQEGGMDMRPLIGK